MENALRRLGHVLTSQRLMGVCMLWEIGFDADAYAFNINGRAAAHLNEE